MTWFPMAFLPPQIALASGVGYSGAVLKAYTAETSTVIPMATGKDGGTTASSFVLNSAGYPTSGGNVIIPHVQENYKLSLYPNQAAADADSGAVWSVDDITIAPSTNTAFVAEFSGDGSTTAFTLASDLGTDEKTIMVFADKPFTEYSTNGAFASDTSWTKGSNIAIAAGVASWSAATTSDLSQTANTTIIAGESYTVIYDVTAFTAGTVTAKIGGSAGTAHGATGTFRETIIAAASDQLIKFSGTGATLSIDNVSVHRTNTTHREILRPEEYTLANTTLTFTTAPQTGTNNILVFAPSLLFGAVGDLVAAAATSEANALTYETLASEWASQTSGIVDATDYSAKAYAIGGTGVTTTSGKGASKEWATTTGGKVDTSEYSAKEYAVGTTVAAGSSKDWATKTSAAVNTTFSAKEYAQGSQASTGGSAKNWASQTGADVTGAAANSRSAKSWAQDANTGATLGGSAKDWAQSASKPDGTNESAKTYASNSSTSATASASSASAASTSASAASTSASAASTSASAASTSATTATTQATNAAASATTATTQAAAALTSETNAATSATSASGSATTATTQATNAATSATAAASSATLAASAAGYQYTYSTTTTASDPGSGKIRFDNTTLASATKLYINETTGASQAIAADIATWDDSTSTNHTRVRMFKQSDPSIFAIFSVTGSNTDNGSWDTLNLSYVGGSGSFANNDLVTIQAIINGDKGDTGATGSAGAAGSIPIAAAAGTVDAITATPSGVTLADLSLCAIVSAGVNTLTNPTFAPNSLTAHTITARGGAALLAGDTGASGYVMLLEYNLANTRWELLNPALVKGSDIQSSAALAGSPTTTTQSAADSSTKIATTAYADTAAANAAAAANAGNSVDCATTAALTGTYANGVSGVGATFTVTATGVQTVDGHSVALNELILLKDQGSAFQNGIYKVTTAGAVGVSPVYTRAADYNQPSDINNTGPVAIINGTVNGGIGYILTTKVEVMGTDALTYALFTPKYSNIIQSGGALGTPSSGTLTNCTGLPVAGGGTGVSTLTTAYGVLCAGTTATGAVQTLSALGASATILTSNGAGALPSFQSAPISNMVLNTGTAGITIDGTDKGKVVELTGSTARTFAITAAATLGSGWWCITKNSSTAELTLDGNGSELDGLANYISYPGEVRLLQCTGSVINSTVLHPFDTGTRTATFTFTLPPGYSFIEGFVWGSGASGGKGATNGGGGGGGGACVPFTLKAATIGAAGTTVTCTVGSGGTAQASANTAGNAGNSSTFGTLVTAYGGGRGGGSSLGAGGGGGGAGSQGIIKALAGSAVSGVGGNATTTTAGTGGVSWEQQTAAAANTAGSVYSGAGGDASSGAGTFAYYGGGSGASGFSGSASQSGGYSIYGGGGGGGGGSTGGGAGGISQFGGNGGAGATGANNATGGTAPGGGGGGSVTGTSGAGGDGGFRIVGVA